MAFCMNCGQQIADDATFCRHCGASVTPQAVETAVQEVLTAPPQAGKKEKKVKTKAVDGGAAVKKSPLPLIIICAVLIVCVIVTIIIVKLTNNPGKKIIAAFDNTIHAESFVCEVETEEAGESYYLEVSSNKDTTRFYFEYDTDRGYLYTGDQLYRIYKGIYTEHKGKNSLNTLECLADRDIEGTLEVSQTAKEFSKDYIRNTEDILPVACQMLLDYFKAPEECEYITKFRQKDDTYRFEIDAVSLAKTAKREYDLEVDIKALGLDDYKEMIFDLDITLDGKYLKKVDLYCEDDNDIAYYATFKKMNAVDFDKSEAAKCSKEALEYQKNQQIIDTYTTYVEAALNAAEKDDYLLTSSYEDILGDQFNREIEVSNPDDYSFHAKLAAQVLNDNGIGGQLYLGYINGYDYYDGYFIQWRESPQSDIIVQITSTGRTKVNAGNYTEVVWGKYFRG